MALKDFILEGFCEILCQKPKNFRLRRAIWARRFAPRGSDIVFGRATRNRAEIFEILTDICDKIEIRPGPIFVPGSGMGLRG